MIAAVIRARSLVGSRLIAGRDYLRAGMLCAPKNLRSGGPTPVQADGWPPEAHFSVIAVPRWFALFLVALVALAWWRLDATIRDEGEHTRLAVHHQETVK